MSPDCLSLSLAFVLTSASPVGDGPQPYTMSVLYAGQADTTQIPATPAADLFPADSTSAPSPQPATLHPPKVPLLRTQPPLVQPIAVGVMAAVAGAYGGAQIGNLADRGDSYEFLPSGTIIGYFVGETILLPLGTHLGNARHGSFLGDLGMSVLGHLGALGLGALGGGAVYFTGIAGQIAMTVANERSTGARRLRAERERERARAEQP